MMNRQDAITKLSAALHTVGTAYLSLTHESRTGTTRHYTVLISPPGGSKIEDITWLVCLVIGKQFNQTYGTIDLKGMRSQDANYLEWAIGEALGSGELYKVVKL